MANESLPFERLTRQLANLGPDDLVSLLKAIDELRQTHSSDPAYQGQLFRAEGIVFETKPDPTVTLRDMLPLIAELNPAQLQVLHTLIPCYFDGMKHIGGEHVSATWGTTHPALSQAVQITVGSPVHISPDDMLQREELFKSVIALVQPAQEAKAAGDNQKALELFDEAMRLLKDQGFSGPMLDYLQNLLKS